MSSKILMPSLSPTMTTGAINKWLVKIGDTVNAGDIIAEIETDKATMELETVDSGKITHLLKESSDTQVPVNSVIAIIDGDKNDKINISVKKISKIEEDKSIDSIDVKDPTNFEIVKKSSESIKNTNKILSSPYVKKIARDQNLQLEQYNGSGPGGRIIKRDIELENIDSKKENSNINMQMNNPSIMRKIIARRTFEAKQEIPHFYLTIESNVDKLIELRKKINKDKNFKISFNDLIVKAIGMAMKKNPNTNVYWQKEKIIKLNNIDVSVAVAIKDGLITPIIKNVNFKGLNEISNEIRYLAKLAKTNSLKPEQYTGGSITVSNLGMFGISEFSAIINQPQASILAVGKIIKKPIVINDEIKIGSTLKSTLSADHRVLDGAIAAKLLKDFNDIIEHPFEIWLKSSDMEVL